MDNTTLIFNRFCIRLRKAKLVNNKWLINLFQNEIEHAAFCYTQGLNK